MLTLSPSFSCPHITTIHQQYCYLKKKYETNLVCLTALQEPASVRDRAAMLIPLKWRHRCISEWSALLKQGLDLSKPGVDQTNWDMTSSWQFLLYAVHWIFHVTLPQKTTGSSRSTKTNALKPSSNSIVFLLHDHFLLLILCLLSSIHKSQRIWCHRGLWKSTSQGGVNVNHYWLTSGTKAKIYSLFCYWLTTSPHPFDICKAIGITKFFKCLCQKYNTGQEDTHIYCHILLLRNLTIYCNLKRDQSRFKWSYSVLRSNNFWQIRFIMTGVLGFCAILSSMLLSATEVLLK